MENDDKYWSLVDDYKPIKECECSLSKLENKLDDLNRRVRVLEEQSERIFQLLSTIDNRLKNKSIIELNHNLRSQKKGGSEPIGFVPTPKPPISSLFQK